MFDVQFITHTTETISYVTSARLALEGGCRWIQLRMKEASADERHDAALQVQTLCREYGATFIIDDHVELVKAIKADGVHLGKMDMPIAEARRILGADFLIGGTANTFADVQQHVADGADYIGCGPYRYTTTKKNLSALLGLEGYKAILKQMHEHHIMTPMVAIGGITSADIPVLKEAGLQGIALSGSILRADNPVVAMREVMQLTL